MSGNARDTKDAPEEGADKAAPPAKPGAAIPVLLIGVVAGALVAGAALGGLLVAPQLNRMRHAAAVATAADPNHGKQNREDKDDKGRKGKKGEPGKSPVYKLDNIIVNPAGSQGQRFLMCSVAIESDDPKALDLLREHEIELRDRVITLLARQTLDRLTAEGARDSLREELLTVIRPTLGPEGQGAALKVFLPQFVVQ
jgi:flagellar basal body-associated protein FliL